MFDKIKIIATTNDNDVELIIKTNKLDTTTKTNNENSENKEIKTTYDNKRTKHKNSGMYITVQTDKEIITIEGSLHKYFNKINHDEFENYSNNFTITDMLKTVENLSKNTNINLKTANVTSLEIGLNFYVCKQPAQYMALIKNIRPKGKNEPFKIKENPKHKEGTEITTNMHKRRRKYYRIYDKINELKDNGKLHPLNVNILRIETVWQRIDKISIADLLHPAYLRELIIEFKETWESIEFERKMLAPKGTPEGKTHLIKEILDSGNPKTVIDKYRKQLKNNTITERRFRTIREFTENEWTEFKTKIIFEASPEEKEFRLLFSQQISKCTKL